MAHILDLPREIQVIIFNHLYKNIPQRDFYLTLSKVCQRWKDIARDCLFWETFDGSLSYLVLLSLSKDSSLLKTKELIFSSVSKLKHSKQLEEILTGLPNLKSVNFSNVKHLQNDVFSCLHKHCKKVNAVKFSEDINIPKYFISTDFLHNFLTLQGEMLLVIDLSNIELKNTDKLLRSIAESCPNLEELLAQNITTQGSPLFPLKVFQECCSKIKVLRLGFPIYFSQHKRNSLPGFPVLEIFTHPAKEIWKFFDNDLINILSKSPNLKVLDIRGCNYISADAIMSLPATHLEHLYVSSTRLVTTPRLSEILTKWIRSLCVVDISKMTLENINEMLTTLSSKGKMINLENLDLSGTKVTAAAVIHLIENCDKLTTLNLSSCRSIGRGFMREYRTKNELSKLHSKLLCQIDC